MFDYSVSQRHNPDIHIKSVNVNWERGEEFLNLKKDAKYNLVAIRSVQKKVLKAIKNGDSVINLLDDPDMDTEDLPVSPEETGDMNPDENGEV